MGETAAISSDDGKCCGAGSVLLGIRQLRCLAMKQMGGSGVNSPAAFSSIGDKGRNHFGGAFSLRGAVKNGNRRHDANNQHHQPDGYVLHRDGRLHLKLPCDAATNLAPAAMVRVLTARCKPSGAEMALSPISEVSGGHASAGPFSYAARAAKHSVRAAMQRFLSSEESARDVLINSKSRCRIGVLSAPTAWLCRSEAVSG